MRLPALWTVTAVAIALIVGRRWRALAVALGMSESALIGSPVERWLGPTADHVARFGSEHAHDVDATLETFGGQSIPIHLTCSTLRDSHGHTLGVLCVGRDLRAFRLADELPPGIDRRAAKTAATDLIMRRIAALLPERQRGRYATIPASVAEPEPVG